MKRSWLIIFSGLLLALAGYAFLYFQGTADQRSIEHSSHPELTWLQQEYHLSDEQFARVLELHDAYAPHCAEMCRRIENKNAELQKLLSATNVVTPEIKQALTEAGEIRAECESAMLDHFYKVAQTMPPDQGRRYFEWAQKQVVKPSKMMLGDASKHALPGMQ